MNRCARLLLLFLSLGFLLGASPSVAEQRAGTRRYAFVPQESSVGFSASSTLHSFKGRAKDVEGYADVDLDRPGESAAGSLRVKVAGMTTENKGRDDAMAECLEPDRHPEITFAVKRAASVALSEDRAKARMVLVGDLTLHGVTNPVEIPVDVSWSEGKIFIRGKKEVSLADFKIRPKGFLFVKVSDKVVVDFDVVGRERSAARP